jgi:hypothetical protein
MSPTRPDRIAGYGEGSTSCLPRDAAPGRYSRAPGGQVDYSVVVLIASVRAEPRRPGLSRGEHRTRRPARHSDPGVERRGERSRGGRLTRARNRPGLARSRAVPCARRRVRPSALRSAREAAICLRERGTSCRRLALQPRGVVGCSRLLLQSGHRQPRGHRQRRIHARGQMQVSGQSSSATCLSPRAQRVPMGLDSRPIGRRRLSCSPRIPRARALTKRCASETECRSCQPSPAGAPWLIHA